jgi:hypothetical protein
MNKKEELKLVEESHYKITSIGARDASLETEGIFKGYANIGIEEAGLLMELGDTHGKEKGKLRIVPLHAILAIDIYDHKDFVKEEEKKDTNQYYS